MKREIKFRAWDTENKRMIDPAHSDWEDFFIEPDGNICVSKETEGTYTSYTYKEGVDLEVMQYTGLKDKNGKEIYEGDIIRQYTGGYGSWFGTVIFHKPDAKFVIETNDDFPSWIHISNEAEIKGNIYENQELLKP